MAIIMEVIHSELHAITVIATDNTRSSFYLKVDGKRVIIDGNYKFATVDVAVDFGKLVRTQLNNEASNPSTASKRLFTMEE